jgi:O-antigen/teichoic acid export membrane protein
MTKYTVLSILPIVLLAIFFVIMLIFRVKLVASGVIAAYVLFNGITLFFLNIEHGFSLKMGFPVKEVLSKNSKYGFQLYVGLLFSVTTAQLLNLLIVNISGLEEYALFALGISLASPMTYVATTMGTVQFKKNVQAKFIKKKEIIITLVISIVAIIGYYIFLNFIIPNLIGHEFIKAIPYANILLFYHTIMGLGDYFNRFVCAKGKGILLRNGAIVSGIVLIISAIVLVPTFKVNGLIIAKIISASVYLVAMIVAYKKTIVIGGKNLD